MQPFQRLTATACPLPYTNIDTDQLIPARFMKRSRTEGYGGYLLHDMRFSADGAEITDFPVNRSNYRNSQIIVARRNFGAGSSREDTEIVAGPVTMRRARRAAERRPLRRDAGRSEGRA